MRKKRYNLKPETIQNQVEAQKNWHAKNTEYLNVGLRKGQKNRYRLLAERKGKSLSSIVKKCLDEECEKEFGKMLKKFVFEGVEGQLVIDNPEPNKYGNIAAAFTWGEIEEYPTFRSLEDADRFVNDQEEIAHFIDQAVHNS